MKITATDIPGVLVITPDLFGDDRGYFMETWNEGKYRAAGISCSWVQDNESCSSYGVLRGLHFQSAPCAQAKLVRVISGAVLDVAVDLRKGSPSYGQHVAIELNSSSRQQLYIPRGFAHGFAVLSPSAVFSYKCDNLYAPAAECGIAADDPALAIDWRIPKAAWIRSPKDLLLPLFSEITPQEER